MFMIVFLVMVAVAAALMTALMRRYALRAELLDVPNIRSSHTLPTPRGGGVAIVVMVLAGLVFLWGLGALAGTLVVGLGVGGALVAGVGYLDDRGHVSARWRLLVHVSAAVFLVAVLGSLPPLPMPGFELQSGWLGLGLAVVFVVWMLNLYNFMDGIDGIAGVQAVTVSGSTALLLWFSDHGNLATLVALYGAASLGFLVWNWPPAKIFMGDAGSGFLGFSFGALAVGSFAETGFPLWAWLILLSVFLVDASVTLVRRVLRGERFYEAHRSHAYQHASRRYGAHLPVTLAVGVINLVWLLPLAYVAVLYPAWGVALLAVAWLPLIFGALRLRAGLPE